MLTELVSNYTSAKQNINRFLYRKLDVSSVIYSIIVIFFVIVVYEAFKHSIEIKN